MTTLIHDHPDAPTESIAPDEAEEVSDDAAPARDWTIVTMVLLGIVLLVGCLVARTALNNRVDRDADTQLNAAAEEFRGLLLASNIEQPGGPTLANQIDAYLAAHPIQAERVYLGMVEGRPYVLRGRVPISLDRLPEIGAWSSLTQSQHGTMETPSGEGRWLAVPVTSQGRVLGTLVVIELVEARHSRIDESVRNTGLAIALVVLAASLWFGFSARRARHLYPTSDFDPLMELSRLYGGHIDEAADLDEDAGRQPGARAAAGRSPVSGYDADEYELYDDHGEPDLEADLDDDEVAALAGSVTPELLSLAPVDLGRLTDDVLAEANDLVDRSFVVERRARMEIVADRELLIGAVMNLLADVVGSTEPGDPIALGSSTDDGVAQIWLSALAPGTEHELELLTDGHDRDPADAPGRIATSEPGIQLSLSIARAHNGAIGLSLDATGRATFRIAVPYDAQPIPSEALRAALEQDHRPAASDEETIIDLRDGIDRQDDIEPVPEGHELDVSRS